MVCYQLLLYYFDGLLPVATLLLWWFATSCYFTTLMVCYQLLLYYFDGSLPVATLLTLLLVATTLLLNYFATYIVALLPFATTTTTN